jgi:uncharacterized protein YdeI (YjbR/CyaY-like superfamily)
MNNVTLLEIYNKNEFRKWLSLNHNKEKKVGLIIHKKHTGKKSPSHLELMEEAICYGWIDTTLNRVDDNKYIRHFSRRNKNSKWSYNTLSYAKRLIKEKRMTPSGLKFYKEGLKKKPHDYDLEKNPDVPADLRKVLDKSKKARENFTKMAPSYRRTYLRWLLRAKREETRKKRINIILNNLKNKKNFQGKDI